MMFLYYGVLLLNFISQISCLDCFTCSATTPGTLCELDPSNVSSGSAIVDCHIGDKQCCMIQRQESNTKKGTVHSLFRSCQSNCSTDNFVSLTGPSYTVFYTYCSEPLCNGGVGNKPLGMKDSELYSTIDDNKIREESYTSSSGWRISFSCFYVTFSLSSLISLKYLRLSKF